MRRVTLQLPETLHRDLASQAQHEGVSLAHYIVYLLTRQLAAGATIQVLPEEAIAQQQTAFATLLAALGQAEPDTVARTFATREPRVPEPELTPDIRQRLAARLVPPGPPDQ